jgi:transcriptional regulator with XRE-family HTH domain
MNKLRIVRAMKRITQFKLAMRTGILQSRLSYIENGLIEPRDAEKRKLSKALGVGPDDIFF